jgi:hypothetical protein
MAFINKEIQLSDFMEQLHKRIQSSCNSDVLIFFRIFLQESLIRAVKEHSGLAPDWDGRVNAGDFDVIYPMAVEIIHDAASRNFSEHSNTYADAHTISIAFCNELNEFFQCTGEEKFDLIPIKSFVDMALKAELLKYRMGWSS